MNRKEFTEALDRVEAFINKIPGIPVSERPPLLMEITDDLREIRRAGKSSHFQGLGERFYTAVQRYARHPEIEQEREDVFRELGRLRANAAQVPE